MTYCYAVKNGMINNKVDMTEQELIVKYTNEDDGTINEKVTGELIRCKKCKYRHKDGFGSGYVCTQKSERQTGMSFGMNGMCIQHDALWVTSSNGCRFRGKENRMADLNFYWRMGDYALEACPKRLVRFSEDEPNVTIDLVKYYQYQGRECKYSIGYFWYNDHEPCWELKFVGGRFKELLEADVVAVFQMLKAAYDTLEEWSRRQDDES